MKKTLFSILTLLTTSLFFGQSVRITTLVEGDCPTGKTAPRIVEIYVQGTVDVTNLKLQCQMGTGNFWVLNNNIGAGTYTDTYLYVVNDINAFDSEFPNVRTANNTTTGTIISSVQGGDKLRIVDSSKGNAVIDIFGVDSVDGETKPWNYVNSYAQRKSGQGPNTAFTESEWVLNPKNTLALKGACWTSNTLNSIVKLKSFTLSSDQFELESMKSLNVFPIPSGDYITLEDPIGEFRIYDVYGKQILSGNSQVENLKIDISSFAKGVYFIKTRNAKSKFIKE